MTQLDGARAVFEDETAQHRFSMNRLLGRLNLAEEAMSPLRRYPAVFVVLRDPLSTHLIKGVLRAIFLIELVKVPKIETTKFEVRWTSRLEPTDPRYASFDDCTRILDQVMGDLEEALDNQANRELLQLFQVRSLLPYEIPLDYRERRTEGQLHCPGNMFWVFDEVPSQALRVRAFLLDASVNPFADLFGEVYEKIKVKTYLTDRVLTGDHKTNREKRWETHPASVHFALRRTCLEIEHTLVSQLCHFEGFPADLLERIQDAGLITPLDHPFRCPITMEALSFAELEREVRDPEHGKASFQVGHLNPLKSGNDDPRSGHTAQNISWISFEGNRIQGNLSLEETRAMIRRIHANYEQSGVQ
jgi:hypothetical protein